VADVAVADLGNDGFTDRMYASDLGGRVWRFDIINGSEPSALVKGGLFASVGLGETTTAPTPDPSPANRRFYYGPDIAIIECGGRRWVNVALGSGNRERPVSDEATQNRFYSLRDPHIFTVLENDDYQSDCSTADPADGPCHQIIRDDDLLLADITGVATPSIPANAVGWKLSLSFAEAEKVLAESRTFESNLLFSSYSPTPVQVSGCGASFGINRLYAISVCTALPVWDNNRDGQVSGVEDLFAAVPFAGIAPEVVVVFPPCTESGAGCWVTPRILLGPVPVGSGEPVRPVRTFWRQEAVR
jgi:type IV pilus assembly protein PilY1